LPAFELAIADPRPRD